MSKPLFTTITIKKFAQSDPTRNVLISSSLFKMAHSYRNFEKYVNYLTDILTHLPPFAQLRIYVDMTTEYLITHPKIASNPNIEIVKYDCPAFHIDSGKFHDGTFGTLMRFLPCFEPFPTGIKYVWITDIDLSYKGFTHEVIKHLERADADILYMTSICYAVPWSKNKYSIMGGRFITRHSFPRSIIENFVTDLDAGKFDIQLSQLHEYIRLYRKKKSGSEAISRFPYGTDEFFTNAQMMHYLKTNYKKAVIQIVLGNFGTLKRTLASAQIVANPTQLEELSIFEWDTWTMHDITKQRIQKYFDYLTELSKLTKYPKCFETFITNLPADIVEHVYTNGKVMGMPCWEKVITLEEATEIKHASPVLNKTVKNRHRRQQRRKSRTYRSHR